MANKIKNYYSRKFLNKKQGVAAVEVKFDSWDYGYGFDSEVVISDCSRSVRLDFSVYNHKDLAEKYTKLNGLIEELSKLQDHFTVNYESIADKITEKQEEQKKRIKERKSQSFSKLVEELNDAE